MILPNDKVLLKLKNMPYCRSCTGPRASNGPTECCHSLICDDCKESGLGSIKQYTCFYCAKTICPCCSDFADRVGFSRDRMCISCSSGPRRPKASGHRSVIQGKDDVYKRSLQEKKKTFFDYFPE